jgi:hypothetical protein
MRRENTCWGSSQWKALGNIGGFIGQDVAALVLTILKKQIEAVEIGFLPDMASTIEPQTLFYQPQKSTTG